MTERREIFRELARRAAIGFPCGVALVYLVFLLGSLFAFPVPEGFPAETVAAAKQGTLQFPQPENRAKGQGHSQDVLQELNEFHGAVLLIVVSTR